MNPDNSPSTHQEVDELLSKSRLVTLQNPKARRVTFLVAVTMGATALSLFLLVIGLALYSSISSKNDLQGQLANATHQQECRATITADINIAKGEGILAGNDATILLLNTVGDIIVRDPANNEEFRTELARVIQNNQMAAEHLRVAMDSSRRILELCQGK